MDQSTALSGWRPQTAEDSVLAALLSIGRLMRQRMDDDQLDLGTFRLMHFLRCQGPIRATDLAALIGLDTSTISRHVQQLERSGLVDRSPDPLDRRAHLVEISGPGRAVLDQGLARRRTALIQRFEGWPRDEIVTLERLLTKFVSDIDTASDVDTGSTTSELEQE